MISLKIQKLFLPIIIIVIIITLRISSFLNSEKYYDEFKEEFKKDLDIISLSKKFLGKLQFFYFEEDDYNVSSQENYYQISENMYYVECDDNLLISKTSGICTRIIRNDDSYTITINSEGVIITYYEVSKVCINLYQYVSSGEEICELKYNNTYYYKVSYEN